MKVQSILLSFCLLLFAIACKASPTETVGTPTPTLTNETAAHLEPIQTPISTVVTEPTQTPVPTSASQRLDGTIQNQILSGVIRVDRPLLIEFDPPLHNPADDPPLLFEPPLIGEFSWNESGSRLTVNPTGGFTPNTFYRVTMSPSLVTQSGEQIGEPLVWNIRTSSALASAESDTSTSEQISNNEWLITFPIDFAGDINWEEVRDAIVIDSHIPLRIHWREHGRFLKQDIPNADGRIITEAPHHFADSNQLWVQILVPFDLQTTYQFALQDRFTVCNTCETGFFNIFEKELSLPPLKATLVQTDIVPQFRLNYPVDLDNLLSAVTFNPEFDTEWYVEWDGEETVITIDPNNLLPNKFLYAFGITEPIYHRNGTLLAMPNELSRFETPFVIEDAYPGREYWIRFSPYNNIEITFTRPMDKQSVIDAFQLEPTTAGTFSWDKNQLIFQPDAGHFEAYSQYTITLGTSMRDSDGRAVFATPYEWQFETVELATDADFGSGDKIQMLDANGPRTIQYRSYMHESAEVTFTMYPLTDNKAIRYVKGNYTGDSQTAVAQWTAITEPRDIPVIDHIFIQERREHIVPPLEIPGYQTTDVPQEIPTGPYLVKLEVNQFKDELLVFISEHTAITHISPSQVLVWTTKMNGEISNDLDVIILNRDGEVIVEGKSSDEGLFDANLEDDAQAELVLVKNGTELTITELYNNWQDSYYVNRHRARVRTPIYVFTDRPIYRPAETVFFKAILRDNDDITMTLPPTGTEVEARLRAPNNEVLQTILLETNDFGSINGQFLLPNTNVYGNYKVEIMATNQNTVTHVVKVDPYQPSNYNVTVSADATTFDYDETITVTIDSRYFTGEPVINATLAVNLHNSGYIQWDQWEKWDQATVTGTTDANGRFTTTVTIPSYNVDIIEAVVSDGTGQTEYGYIQETQETVGNQELNLAQMYQTTKHPIEGDGVVIEPLTGKPIANGILFLELKKYTSEDYVGVTVYTDTIRTNENGRYIFSLPPQDAGPYSVSTKIVSPAGDSSFQKVYFIVYDNHEEISNLHVYYGHEPLNFVYEKDTPYIAGEKTKLFIESTVAGPALLTAQRATVESANIIELTPPLTVVDVEIPNDGAPNITFHVDSWTESMLSENQANAYYSPEYRRLLDFPRLLISTETQKLNIELIPSASPIVVGEETQLTVRVTDHEGSPVSAELSLSVIDESIFEIIFDSAKSMHDTFYFMRPDLVRSYTPVNRYRSLEYNIQNTAGDHSGMSYYSLFENYRNMHSDDSVEPRIELNGPRGPFEPTAAWYPALQTDENGEATISVILPESATNWRLEAKAITTDTQVGEAVFSLTTD